MAKTGKLKKNNKAAATTKAIPKKIKGITKSSKSTMKPKTVSRKKPKDQQSTFQTEDDFLCPICLNTYPHAKATKSLKCGHCFHRVCVSKWFLMSSGKRCPVCRRRSIG
ncbi:hypothetical protein JTE90_017055 [Oedothorax gibbosus]|uniref:RING-type E3 ubiquitin transferase n=1 Tax=Oedothorax gibbosus TaxID=931172 RepID=A0AAV6UKU9_9ARAC|nr:hypothetical protein JTE90_017055 [Oedothorax gibbosus]